MEFFNRLLKGRHLVYRSWCDIATIMAKSTSSFDTISASSIANYLCLSFK